MSSSVNSIPNRPLSPADFATDLPRPTAAESIKLPGAFGADDVPAGSDENNSFDASDKINLQFAVNLLKDARLRARTGDATAREAAAWDIVQTASYFVGYFDGKGLLNTAPPHAGYASFEDPKRALTIDQLLDGLEATIAELLDGSQTRRVNGTKVLLNSAGDYCIGIAGSLTATVIAAFVLPGA